MEEQIIYSMDIKNVQDKIEEYLPVRQNEKRKYGEVFTPIRLIEEMIDKLPNSVWNNPNLKWLDPANGIGNFPMVIFMRLNDGLKDVDGYRDENIRKNHIIKNMLYMIELNEKNVDISRTIFGIDANIYCGSFLEDGWKSAFGIDKFDVIVGNPPFNASQENEGKKGGGSSLWSEFVKNSINLLVNNGYLLFIHPSGWRKPNTERGKFTKMFDLMTKQNQMLYLEIHGIKDGQKMFNCGTRYDWYLLKKKSNTEHTIIKDQNGDITNINLKEWDFLPNYNFNKIKQILGNSDTVIYSRNQFGTDKSWVNENKTEKYKYPLIHSMPLSGVRYYWSLTKNPEVKNFIEMFDIPKVIFDDTINMNDVIIDESGKYGLTQHSIGFKIKNEKEGKLLKQALMSEKFKDLINAMSFSNYQLDWRMFKYFKPDFYEYF